MTKAFYLETFGCQMNVVDSEQIAVLLNGLGYEQVDAAEKADLVLLNTCSVRDKAERKVYGHLGRFKPIKDQRPELIIAVGGCVAQQEGERMLEKVPYLDIVFGTHNIHKLPELVQQVEEGRQRGSETHFFDRETRLNLFPERSQKEGVTRFVTIMQGCDNFCSYCIVPHVRGREISRPSADVIGEIKGLVEQGVKEVTLLGQNVNSYGIHDENEVSFAELLYQVNAIEGLERLRFATSHPKDLTDELINCFASLDKLCKHMHLPVQCGSDHILDLMNRHYTAADYLRQVDKLKTVCPDIRFTSDIIVGFPREKEEDFLATLEMVKKVRYVDAYTFLYSPRIETAAASMERTSTPEEIQERFERLVALQQEISAEIWASDVGQVQDVLVEGESKQGEGQMFGRTTWNRIVNFPGSVDLVGKVVPVKIINSFRNSHLGELVDEA